MWWTIAAIGAVFFAILILYAWIGNERRKGVGAELILERVAKEYLKRRQRGETMDQIEAALYNFYSASKSDSASKVQVAGRYRVMRQIPEDGRRLGEIAYTLLCNRGVYPTPREDQGLRDSDYKYDATIRMCSVCSTQIVLFEATGNNVDARLWEMMKEWSALHKAIVDADAKWEKTMQKALREPERPEMRDRVKGMDPKDGLFGTRWLMRREEALQVLPEPEETTYNSVGHFGIYHGRRASFSYKFKENLLTEITVCLNKSSETEYRKMHALLSAEFGRLPEAVPSKFLLFSKGEVGGLVIEHQFFELETVGLTEMIIFKKAPSVVS